VVVWRVCINRFLLEWIENSRGLHKTRGYFIIALEVLPEACGQ